MSEVVAGRERYAPADWPGSDHAHPCLFCNQTVVDGAMWAGDVQVWICKHCIEKGKFGTLAADARVAESWIAATVAEYDRCSELAVVRQANHEFAEPTPTDPTERREWYHRYLKSPAWQARRLIALDNAGHHCQVCNGNECLDVHHRTYERIGAEHHNDLTVLCRECHETFHKAGRLAA